MTIKRSERPFDRARKPEERSQDRYRSDAQRRDMPTAEIHAHPRYMRRLRQTIQDGMDEFRQARTTALDRIDQRIHELARLKHEMDPVIATELMVALAETRSILLSLDPAARESKKTLADLSDRLRTLVRRQQESARK